MLSITNFKLIILVFLFSSYIVSYSQISKNVKPLNTSLSEPKKLLETTKDSFLENVTRDYSKNNLPYYLENYILKGSSVPTFNLNNSIIRELTFSEVEKIEEFKKFITANFEISSTIGKSRFEDIVYAKIIPIRLNASTGKYEFLESYVAFWNNDQINSQLTIDAAKRVKKTSNVTSSVLATGKWYKIGVTKDGVYKINKSFLSDLGLDIENIDPRTIRIYGNGGKLMPEKNSVFRYDDLQENAIAVVGENDGVFDSND
jgi:hypothetical protein